MDNPEKLATIGYTRRRKTKQGDFENIQMQFITQL
jgi:hypothetical protein